MTTTSMAAEGTAPVRERRSRPPGSRLRTSQRRAGIAFALPVIVLELLLLAVPIAQAAYFSFTRWDGITASWIGPANYQRLFSDPTFWRVIANNLLLLASVPFAIFIPLLVAYLLNEHVPGWRFFRSAYFLPTAISWVVIGMVALRVWANEGLLNHVLSAFGLGFIHTDMLAGELSAMEAVAITFIWSVFGTNTIIFITGMATLDRDVYEAARVDGAGAFTTFVTITIPMLMGFIQFAFILTLITAFTALFSLIFVMTGGGPGYGTTTLEFYVYQQGFQVGVFGYAAAIGIVLFAIVFAISLAQLRIFRSRLD
ncbi:MAG TPA: sugar ABC transporter permease [Candidatus Limnocylindrales bacterium]|jgi:multiple sugar transport system permease protein